MLVLDGVIVFLELSAGSDQIIDTAFELFQGFVVHQAAPELRLMVINIGLAPVPVNASGHRRAVLNCRPAR